MRVIAAATLTTLALAACSPSVPNSAADAELRATDGASGLPPAAAVTTAPLDEGAALAADTTIALGLTPEGTPPTGAPLNAMAPIGTPDAAPSGTPGISDEQDFGAVSGRETIESDAARIAENRAQYQVIEPEALPQRPDGSGASIVAYALATNNVPGQTLYRRSALFASQARFERACARYGSADRAQEAFLDAGGPERDRHGMDPDGDGFACYWDPRPFRAARDGAPEVVTEYEVIETPGES